jgi:hypothetical protein
MEDRNPNSPDWPGIVAVFATALLVLALVNGLTRLVPREWLPDPSYVMSFRRP